MFFKESQVPTVLKLEENHEDGKGLKSLHVSNSSFNSSFLSCASKGSLRGPSQGWWLVSSNCATEMCVPDLGKGELLLSTASWKGNVIFN